MVNNHNNNQGLVRKGAIALVLMAGLLGACEANRDQANNPGISNDREAMDNRANEEDQQAANTVPGTENSTVAQTDNNQASSPVPSTDDATGTMAETETDQVEQVSDNSEQLIGQTVTVKGEVEESYGSNLYRVQEQGEVFGDSVLVLTVPPQPENATTLATDQNVQVTGQVQQFAMANFEQNYNLNLEPGVREQLQAEYEGKPVIVAETLQVFE